VQVIYEDNHIIAVNKACGEIVQDDETGDVTLLDIVKDYLKKKYNKPGNVYLGLPHRLDRPTTGVVLLAKTEKALIRLNKMFQTRGTIKKTYWAVVDSRPPKYEDKLEHYLVKNQEKNRSMAFKNPRSDGKYASLTYRHIASSERYHLLEIELHTGRHHQIRVQLRQLKLHIKGDVKYGFPRANEDKGIHLHARKIEFEHPVKKEQITIVADPPDDVLWNEFMTMFRNNRFSPVHPV
jgi:23S rRNA pseudouridine1911/1915/1917 synthase